MLNLILIIESFDDTQPLNIEANTVREIDSKFYFYENHKGNVHINEKIRFRNRYPSEINDFNRDIFRFDLKKQDYRFSLSSAANAVVLPY